MSLTVQDLHDLRCTVVDDGLTSSTLFTYNHNSSPQTAIIRACKNLMLHPESDVIQFYKVGETMATGDTTFYPMSEVLRVLDETNKSFQLSLKRTKTSFATPISKEVKLAPFLRTLDGFVKAYLKVLGTTRAFTFASENEQKGTGFALELLLANKVNNTAEESVTSACRFINDLYRGVISLSGSILELVYVTLFTGLGTFNSTKMKYRLTLPVIDCFHFGYIRIERMSEIVANIISFIASIEGIKNLILLRYNNAFSLVLNNTESVEDNVSQATVSRVLKERAALEKALTVLTAMAEYMYTELFAGTPLDTVLSEYNDLSTIKEFLPKLVQLLEITDNMTPDNTKMLQKKLAAILDTNQFYGSLSEVGDQVSGTVFSPLKHFKNSSPYVRDQRSLRRIKVLKNLKNPYTGMNSDEYLEKETASMEQVKASASTNLFRETRANNSRVSNTGVVRKKIIANTISNDFGKKDNTGVFVDEVNTLDPDSVLFLKYISTTDCLGVSVSDLTLIPDLSSVFIVEDESSIATKGAILDYYISSWLTPFSTITKKINAEVVEPGVIVKG